MMIPLLPQSIEGALDFKNTTVFKFNASIQFSNEITVNTWKKIPTEKIIVGLRAIGNVLGFSYSHMRGLIKSKLVKGRYIFLRRKSDIHRTVYCSYRSLLALFESRYYGKNMPKIPCILIVGIHGLADFIGVKQVIFSKKYRRVFEADGTIFRAYATKSPYANPCLCAFTNMLIASLIRHPELDYQGAINQYG